jgi:hypothetical protein
MAITINGDGVLTASGTASTQGRVILAEQTGNGTNTVTLQAPASLAADLTLTMPAADGTNGQVLQTNGSGALSFGAVSTLATPTTDSLGNIRAIPQSGSAKTSSYTLTTTDIGAFIQVGSSGAIVVPDATFSAGDVVSIFNNTSGNITITCSITTAYIGGTDTDKATMTLATRGIATVLFISGTVCVVSGNVS